METCVISSANVIPIPQEANPDNSERSLVQRAQRGDEQAFATLFQVHSKRVYSVCLLMTKDVAEAEDLTQEAFLQVFRTITTFRGDSAFSTWLYRVAVNTVLMKFRRTKTNVVLSLSEPESPNSPSLQQALGRSDPRLTGTIDRITLLRAIEELPGGCRSVFILHEIGGYEHHEIARLRCCSIGNSKSQLHRAKLRMRDLLFPKRRVLRRRGTVRGTARLDATDFTGLLHVSDSHKFAEVKPCLLNDGLLA
jgi:RNA polymerase sigma-70 factor (ECF subfamily)